MGLMDIPQSKWGSGTGRQVILKSDFLKIEAAVAESFEIAHSPSLEYVDGAKIRVNATADSKARAILCGFPSPLHRGLWVDGDLCDGRLRENAAAVTLDFAQSGALWGTEKVSQWYAIYALAGNAEAIFSLKAMPVMRVSSQSSQIITLRNNFNTADIGYGFSVDELAGAKLLMLTGASRGLMRAVTANNGDSGTGGTLTYGGTALTLSPGDWFVVLPDTNFRYLGMVLNNSDGSLEAFYQEGGSFFYRTPRLAASGAINGYTLTDLGVVVPPTARRLEGFAAATSGSDVKLAISYDGANPALVVHASQPSGNFQGTRGAIPFAGLVPEGHRLYLNNENSANQLVKITAWEE